MSAEPGRANLRLLNPDAVVGPDDPQSYAEALVLLHDERARREALKANHDFLKDALAREVIEHRRTKAKLNKDLRLHKDYAAVERLWQEVWRPAHPRAGEDVPEDWLKMALARLKDFDEAQLARALYGAIRNPAVNEKDGTVYDQWDNALRSTGHVNRHIQYADVAEGRAHREREAHPEVARVLAAVGVASLKDLENRCDRCGELMIRHGGKRPCADPDDIGFRSERWIDEQEARIRQGRSVSETAAARVALRRKDDGRG